MSDEKANMTNKNIGQSAYTSLRGMIRELEKKLEDKEYDIEKLAVKYVPLYLFEKVALNVEALEKKFQHQCENCQILMQDRVKDISELQTKFESYTTTNHTQAIREDQQKQIAELKASSASYMERCNRRKENGYNESQTIFGEIKELQAKVSNPEWLDVVILKLMEPMKEVLLDFINFHWSLESEGQTHEKDLTYEEKYNKHAELSKKLSGGCTSQCGKDWNDSFCSDCNDSKPIKPIEGPISYAPKTDSKPEEKCPHGTLGGIVNCMECRPELMKLSGEQSESISDHGLTGISPTSDIENDSKPETSAGSARQAEEQEWASIKIPQPSVEMKQQQEGKWKWVRMDDNVIVKKEHLKFLFGEAHATYDINYIKINELEKMYNEFL